MSGMEPWSLYRVTVRGVPFVFALPPALAAARVAGCRVELVAEAVDRGFALDVVRWAERARLDRRA